jgi:hypothetical protein
MLLLYPRRPFPVWARRTKTYLIPPDHPSLHRLTLHAPPLASPFTRLLLRTYTLIRVFVSKIRSFVDGTLRARPRSSASQTFPLLHQKSAGLHLCSSAFIWGCNKMNSCSKPHFFIDIPPSPKVSGASSVFIPVHLGLQQNEFVLKTPLLHRHSPFTKSQRGFICVHPRSSGVATK